MKRRLTYEEAIELSRPTLCGFNPDVIPWQRKAIDTFNSWDFSRSTPEMLFYGTYGSAKTLLLAHIAVRHCLKYNRARVCIARRALPDLRRTLYADIVEHIEEDLVENRDYWRKDTTCYIRFKNGSEIIAASWADKRYSKFRSLKLSGLIISEIVENSEEDKEAFSQLKARVRRLPHIKENFVLADTNPDSEDHWVYSYWLKEKHKNRPWFFSDLRDNPFLDEVYLQQLEEDLDPKSAERYLRGRWCDVITKRIYYNYKKEIHFKKRAYEVDEVYPIYISFDFNIADGKPLSCVVCQRVPNRFDLNVWHFFGEVVIEGIGTEDACHKLAERGFLDYRTRYEIHGDATGRAKDTRSKKSDFDLIESFMRNYRTPDGRELDFEMRQPFSNPPVRTRHIKVNSVLKNLRNEIRFACYETAPTVDEGMRLTKLKKNEYKEDDSLKSQHITTAIGYVICQVEKRRPEQKTILL